MENPDFLMERRTLLGIKHRAEASAGDCAAALAHGPSPPNPSHEAKESARREAEETAGEVPTTTP